LSGKTVLPEGERFHLYSPNETPTLANVLLVNGVVMTDYTQPLVVVDVQGYLIGTARAKGADGIDYLIAYMGQESAPSNGTSKRYIVRLNLGGFDTTDRDLLLTGGGGFVHIPSPSEQSTPYSVSEMEDKLTASYRHFVVFDASVETGSVANGPDQYRDPKEIEAQNAAAKAFIEFSKQTLVKPLSRVSQNTVRGIITSTPVIDVSLDASSIPSTIGIRLP
jgi:hypothetical protein